MCLVLIAIGEGVEVGVEEGVVAIAPGEGLRECGEQV